MTYFVTGATGFIGRRLVERLLQRDGDIYVLVREASRSRLEEQIVSLGAEDRIHPVVGDLVEQRLGVDAAWIDEHTGKIDHFFHLAAVYDMTADDATNESFNVDGTRHAVDLANALDVGHLHHVSSIAVAGLYRGLFREDMFDEGQKLPSPYHRTKFESERIARDHANVPLRVYRPGVVVGDSQTGVMDKVDGPYYFFKLLQKLRDVLPPGSRSSGRSSAGRTSSPSTSWRPRSTTSRTSTASTARRSTSRTRIPSGSARSSTCSPVPATPRSSPSGSTAASPMRCRRAPCRC